MEKTLKVQLSIDELNEVVGGKEGNKSNGGKIAAKVIFIVAGVAALGTGIKFLYDVYQYVDDAKKPISRLSQIGKIGANELGAKKLNAWERGVCNCGEYIIGNYMAH